MKLNISSLFFRSFFLGAFLIILACQGNSSSKSAPVTTDELNELASSMYDTTAYKLNKEVAERFVDKTVAYAEQNPEESSNVFRLLRAGETARSLRKYEQAISIYDMIYNKYPQHEKSAQALFLKGFTLDNDLKKLDEARAVYQAFLEKHPDNDFADDTEFLLGNLGKSDEEILRNWTGKEKPEGGREE